MKKYSKRYLELRDKIVIEPYSPKDAIKLVKELSNAKFDESVEAHISLNINTKYADQQLRSNLVLPHGTGKSKRIAVLIEESDANSITSKNVVILNLDELLVRVDKNEIDFDILLTTPSMMPKIARLGKTLSSRGLMPSIKSGTITTSLDEAIKEFESGKFEYRADKTGIVHMVFGKATFSVDDLINNLSTLYNHIENNKPSGVKGKFFKNFYICTTMSPSIKIDFSQF
uniref:Large ribosomal subunit protein uL1c n=1 Tax=Olisthodiscus luteus TaxID=83000 RepID=A0A7U0QFV0_OLILU|nr:ribosomal protein L1 [Olisthodiscus luteus]QQW50439.1 ribosomal protein L1 [Olisthodiscus luteus]